MLSQREGLALRAGSGTRLRKVEIGARGCISVAEEFAACLLQECGDVPCFGDVCTVAGDDWVTVASEAVSITRREAKETVVKNGLEEGKDGELGKLHFGFRRDN